jgi:hypothetical protein
MSSASSAHCAVEALDPGRSFPRADLHIAQLPSFRVRLTKFRGEFTVLARGPGLLKEEPILRDLKCVHAPRFANSSAVTIVLSTDFVSGNSDIEPKRKSRHVVTGKSRMIWRILLSVVRKFT